MSGLHCLLAHLRAPYFLPFPTCKLLGLTSLTSCYSRCRCHTRLSPCYFLLPTCYFPPCLILGTQLPTLLFPRSLLYFVLSTSFHCFLPSTSHPRTACSFLCATSYFLLDFCLFLLPNCSLLPPASASYLLLSPSHLHLLLLILIYSYLCFLLAPPTSRFPWATKNQSPKSGTYVNGHRFTIEIQIKDRRFSETSFPMFSKRS